MTTQTEIGDSSNIRTVCVKQKRLKEFTKVRGLSMVAVACCLIGLPTAALADPVFIPSSTPTAPLGGARVTGEVTALSATTAQLALRNGQSITVNLKTAQANHLVGAIFVGDLVVVQGSLSGGVITAISAHRAKSNPDAWMQDIP